MNHIQKELTLLKLNARKLFLSKTSLIVLLLLILTNTLGFSSLFWLPEGETLSIKLTTNLQILFWVILINLFIILIATIFVNNILFYNPLSSGLTNMEIIAGYSKPKIWFTRFLLHKFWLLLIILVQVLLVNIIILFYKDEYQNFLMSQKLFWWIYLFFLGIFFDLIYHTLLSVFKQQAVLVVVLFLTGMLISLLLILNSLQKNNDYFGKGETKNNLAYRQISLGLKNYNDFEEQFNGETAAIIKDYVALKTKLYSDAPSLDQENLLPYLTDSFFNSNPDNKFWNIIQADLETIQANKPVFNLTFDEASKVTNANAGTYFKKVLTTMAGVKNQNFYLDLASQYETREYYEAYRFSGFSFLYHPETYLNLSSQIANYQTLYNNPELMLLIDFYKNLMEDFYNMYTTNQPNAYLYTMYLEQSNLNKSFFSGIRWDFLNQLSLMLYGSNHDVVYDYLLANSTYAPASNLIYQRQVQDEPTLQRYSKKDLDFVALQSADNNFKLDKTIFTYQNWYTTTNRQVLIEFSQALVAYYYAQMPFYDQKWDVVYHLKPNSSISSSPEVCKTEPNVSVVRLGSDPRYRACGLESVDIRAGVQNWAHDSGTIPNPRLVLYSQTTPTKFMAESTSITKTDLIDIYSAKYFSSGKTTTIINYYALFLPWFFIILSLDLSTYWLFLKKYEKMW